MKRFFGQCLLKATGRYFEIRELNSANACAVDANSPQQARQWQITPKQLSAGWYMLEVEHDAARSVGCDLSLWIDGRDERLLLNSKKICKRIVFVPKKGPALVLCLTGEDPQLKKVSLVALSSRFAQKRMHQRLTYHTDCQTSAFQSSQMLYERYREHFHQHGRIAAYTPRQRELTAINDCAPLKGTLHLSVGSHKKDAIHSSLSLAVKRAMALGATIEWIEFEDIRSALSNLQSLDIAQHNERLDQYFLMPVLPGIRYKVDAIEVMLRAATQATQLIYADHDHIDLSDQYHHPVLKPEWNPELLLNTNYIEQPFMLRYELLARQQSNTDADDHLLDVVLVKAALTLSASQVVRVSEVLATVQTPVGDDHNSISWREAVRQVLSKDGSDARVGSGLLPQTARIIWPLPRNYPAVDIIIPTRDNIDVLRTCVESVLAKTSYPNYRIQLVDNDSTETKTFDFYKSIKRDQRVALLYHPGLFNYSAINNAAVKQTHGDIVLLLNNDTEVINEGWLDEMVRQAIRTGAGCVGAKLYYSNGTIQHGGVITGITGIAGHAHRYQSGDSDGYCGRLKLSQNFSAVTAACLAVRRETFEQVGGLDELELGVAWNDVDFCLRVKRAGLNNIWTPYAELFHHEGLTRGADDTKNKVLRARAEFAVMQRRWHLDQHVDPAYHPYLTRDHEDFSLSA